MCVVSMALETMKHGQLVGHGFGREVWQGGMERNLIDKSSCKAQDAPIMPSRAEQPVCIMRLRHSAEQRLPSSEPHFVDCADVAERVEATATSAPSSDVG
mmetsp:Transcript_36062/g.95023  ORF Transcript_36062/g.95023 Transcript_36062/m.95023 type:complete len:100 (-) Transcript_36062:873-1172(-)